MSVEKVQPNYLKKSGFELPYTIILNNTIDIIPDNSALGVYLYLARKPEDWIIQEKDIMNRFKKGRDHVRKCLSLLKKIGLYKKESMRDEQGHITHWESTLYAQVTENPSSSSIQVTEKPTSGKTHLLDKPTHTKERGLQKKDTISEQSSPSTSFPSGVTPLDLASIFSEELPGSPQPVFNVLTKALDGKSRHAITRFKKYWLERMETPLTAQGFGDYLRGLKVSCPGFLAEYTGKGGKRQINGFTSIINEENFEKYLKGTLY
jgi:hypothetical protein